MSLDKTSNNDLDYKIISISGNARVGKDTFADFFVEILEQFGIQARKLSFADQLKRTTDSFLLEQIGISAFTEDPKEKSIIRPFLVTWGTEVMRKLDDDVWVKSLEEMLRPDVVNIIPDLRFPNELKMVKKYKGMSLFLDRDGVEPANNYEKENNEILKKDVDMSLSVLTTENSGILKSLSSQTLDSLTSMEVFELWKATCH